MSIQTALDNIYLRSTACWGHTEYSLYYHKDYLASRTGLPENDPGLLTAAQDHFAYDFLWRINDRMVDWNKVERVTDMGHASYAVGGSDQREPVESPLKSMDEA